MNTTKKSAVLNNGWILCPSKTFSGKFYYFNVASGEAVWTLDSNEKTTPKKDNGVNVQNINNKFHSYPEPSTPPDDSPNNTPPNIWPSTSTSNSWPTNRKPYFQNEKYTFKGPSVPWTECKQTPFQNQMFTQQTPMFGQPPHFVTNLNPFMPTMPNVGLPSFVWTPMQLPMSQWPVMTSDRKPVIDRDTQTPQIDRGVFVHTSGIPLNQKFINYEKPSLYFNTENKLINKPKYFATSTPLKNTNSAMEFFQNHTPSKSIPEQVLNMETESPMNKVFGKSTSRISDNEKATLNPCSKIKFPKNWVIEELEMENKTNLHESDLRLLLNAKRKKLLEVNDPVEKKKPKIDGNQGPVKKRVSFEMDKINETSITITDEQKRVNQFIPTTKYNSSFYEIRTSNSQTNINDSNTFENKITKRINNIPKHDISTDNEDVTNAQNDMTIDNITSKQYNIQTTNDIPSCQMNISKKKDKNNIPLTENTDDCPKEVPRSMPQYKEVKLPEFGIEAPTVSPSYTVRDIWYLIVDIDVLLEDLALVDQLLKSDEKCRLVIPHCIHSQLEALCIGDCRGQQRVFVARQLIRRISTPQKQYIVEPPPLDENTNIETKDGILDCCMRVLENQHCVILITNNPYLREKASTQNICCFNTDEIRNGAILKPRLFAELKKIKVIVENENKNDTTDDNQEPASIPIDVYKKQLFVKDKQIEKNCDILINITKPKMDQTLLKTYQLETNNRVQLNLEETKQEYENQPQCLSQNKYIENKTNTQETENASASHTYNFENLKVRNQDPNTFNANSFIPNTKSDTHKNITKSPEYFQTNNPQNSKVRFDSTPNDDNYLLRASISDGIKTNETSDDHNAYSRGVKDIVSTASRQRIEKIISALNPKLPNKNTPNLKSFNKFKVPKLIPFKKETKVTTPLKGSSVTTDSIRSNFQNYEQSLEGSLKKFCVKNKMMQEKLTTKMDEWICTYTQIMEHLLTDTLQNNSAYMRQMNVSNANLHESLTCLKMLYNDTKLRKILQVLVKLLDQCTCSKGKIKLDTAPNDFMKMIGCAVLLVQALKTILPDFKVLDDYESILNCLISNIESKTIDVDPELLRPTAVCRSEIENANKEARRNFSKNPSVIIEYLKKHYKAWSSYDHKQDGESSQTNDTPNGNCKVVRLSGRNINMLKIDNNKSLSYINTIKESNPILEKEAETKLVKLLDSYQLNQDPTIADNVHLEDGKQRKAALRKQSIFSIDSHTEISENDKERTVTGANTTIDNDLSTKNQPKLKRFTENIKQYSKDDRNENKEPNVIRNIKLLDEHETRIKNKEPLDLDHLDYSEINDSNAEAISGIFNEHDENDFANSDDCNFKSDDFGCDNYKIKSTTSFFQSCLANNNFSTTINDNNSMRNIDMNEDDINDLQNKSITVKKCLLMCKEIDKMEAIDIIKQTKENFDNSTINPPRDDSTNDSGFENETCQAQTLVQIFFKELSNTFQVLYKFIVAFVQEIREEVLCEERKNLLHIKSSKRLQAIRAVIKQLKCIIERESAEDTPFKATLLRYDLQSTKDPRMSQYR
ncbi:unnamed protein product [Arctia plantaginis]|uniref:PIN domain-containing protein n=1 Tax=Arctia plantaginis TaxID=874455 RepID=A0A8S1BGW6_ARCPL|nr:unnamed protein product [Arctia plantaginis]